MTKILNIIFIILSYVFIFTIGGWVGSETVDNPIPSCTEDEIIIGTGDYSNGHWSQYVCSHSDLLDR